ncbi:MAG: hypothetical protein QOK16_3413 [Solirubrobacteraceae bacterium]|jgi:hypothetical protein|nr:hypothetical protein [Solirubrobacteraceae bacterium]MEA2188402.1 hypothetical protein [Solirubrobacteraceae bacterium]
MSSIRKITAAVSAAALLGAGGISAANAASTPNDGPAGSRPTGSGPRPGGPMPAGALDAIAQSLGVTSTQLTAALDATRPPRPADGARPDRGAGLASDLAKALDVDLAQVKAILDANRPAKPAEGARKMGKHARPDNSKLVAALARGLHLERAAVQAAFDTIDAARKTEHDSREAAMYAAIASKLGVSANAVKAAFEANRPAKPARASASASAA